MLPCHHGKAADPETISNYRSGISLSFEGVPGKDYVEEYFYHDRKVWDSKTVYIKASTPITMTLNEFASPPGEPFASVSIAISITMSTGTIRDSTPILRPNPLRRLEVRGWNHSCGNQRR